MKIQSEYHEELFDPKLFKIYVAQAITEIEKIEQPFDSIAFRGASGMILAPSIALKLNKSMTLVRKKHDIYSGSHSTNLVEGAIDCNYLIVDDFVSTGLTVLEIQRAIANASPKSRCIGIYQYKSMKFSPYNPDLDCIFIPIEIIENKPLLH